MEVILIVILMGSAQQAIKMAIIDLRSQPKDFTLLTQNKLFSCNFYDSYDKFLENQSLKELSYIIIREKRAELKNQQQIQDKIKESSVVAKTHRNMEELARQCKKPGKYAAKEKRQPLLRQRLIAYIRKYSLERLVIYLLVDNVLDFKIPEYEQPYVTLVADKIEVIKSHLEQKPKGADPLNFKFRRLIKDLYRRTVVKILNTQTEKEVSRKNREEWNGHLGKITHAFSNFNQEQFQESLMSNYFQYIVVSNSAALSFIQDMKRKHKFQSLIIYYGSIQHYGKDEYSNQTQDKLNEVKKSLWMYSHSISQICHAVKNCTDIVAEQTTLRAKNVVIYTYLDYGAENQAFFVNKLVQHLNSPNFKNNDVDKQWIRDLQFKVVSRLEQLKDELKKVTFSYLITFDCTVDNIEVLKSFLRQQKLHKRAYMYNAEEKENAIDEIKQKKAVDEKVKHYLSGRAKKTMEKAGFVIKFEIGPIDEITSYKASEKELVYLRYELGLQTENIQSYKHFQSQYLSKNRQKIVLGFCMIIKVNDYFKQYKELLLADLQADPGSYLKKIKIIILDDLKSISASWVQLQHEVQNEKIVFVHYNLNKVSQFLDILYVPTISLSIFVKKALPNFYKAYQKLEESKFKRIQMTATIVSKNQLLKEVFEDQTFKLSTQYNLSFFKLTNATKNLDQALIVIHEQFLVRYGIMWRTGYQMVSLAKRQRCIQTLKEDIKACLFKCKSYQLLQVSQQQFEYFYLKRLEQSKTYLELQITMIYMFSLPHGLANVIQLIFSQGLSTCLSPKVFAGVVVLLLSAFCSFEDEVMNKKKFVVYLEDSNSQHFKSVLNALKIGDILFNSCFIMSGKCQDANQNAKNNCIFLQFQDIPMLSETHIKNYLYIERFSFYKQSTEYLIAPYTQFTVKNIDVSPMGKTHITLIATPQSKKGLVSKVFHSNRISEHQLFDCITSQIKDMSYKFSEEESKRIKETGSLYKKAELIGLYEQKIELFKSIREGFEYNRFLKAARQKKYMTALSHIKRKQVLEKSTTEIQATYFKKMIGVEKAMLFYHLCQYDISVKQLDKVIAFLQEQNVEGDQMWAIKKVKTYKQSVNQLNTKRHKYLNRSQKTKYWKIETEVIKNQNSVKLGVKMQAKKMKWNVGYAPLVQQFYIQSENGEKLVHYNIKPAFGQLATVFPPNSSYQKISERNAQQKMYPNIEKILENQRDQQYKREKVNKKQPKNLQKQLQKKTRNQNTLSHKNQKEPVRTTLPKIQINSPVKQQLNPSKQPIQQNNTKNNNSHIESPDKSQKKQASFLQSPKKLQQLSIQSSIRQKSVDSAITQSDISMGIREQLNWQAFFFDGKFLLTQKGKHYKTKMSIKRNL